MESLLNGAVRVVDPTVLPRVNYIVKSPEGKVIKIKVGSLVKNKKTLYYINSNSAQAKISPTLGVVISDRGHNVWAATGSCVEGVRVYFPEIKAEFVFRKEELELIS